MHWMMSERAGGTNVQKSGRCRLTLTRHLATNRSIAHNSAIINEDPLRRKIRLLEEQVEQLTQELAFSHEREARRTHQLQLQVHTRLSIHPRPQQSGVAETPPSPFHPANVMPSSLSQAASHRLMYMTSEAAAVAFTVKEAEASALLGSARHLLGASSAAGG